MQTKGKTSVETDLTMRTARIGFFAGGVADLRQRLAALALSALSMLAVAGTGVWAAEADRPLPEDLGAESASHREIAPLPVRFQRISGLRLDGQGHLLAGDEEAEEIKVIDADGTQLTALKPQLAPEVFDVAADGTIYCGGRGRLVKLDPAGRVLQTAELPENADSVVIDNRRGSKPTQLRLSGIAASEKDVFVAFGRGWGQLSQSKLFRFDRELGHPKLIAEGLRACCQRCDVAISGGLVYVAENKLHRVVCYDREGTVRDKWGQGGRTELEHFGSCCNPMNLWIDSQGVVYTAESGLGRVKRYSADGKFLGLVGYVGVERFQTASMLAVSCSNIAIAVTRDGRRVYVTDAKNNCIRVLEKKG